MKEKVLSVMMAAVILMLSIMMIGCEKKEGKLYYFNTMYANEIISRDDVLHIVYFSGGTNIEVGDGSGNSLSKENAKIDFKPQVELTSMELDEKLEKELKQAFYKRYKDTIDRSYEKVQSGLKEVEIECETVLDMIIIEDYYGQYKDMYMARMRAATWLASDGKSKRHRLGDYEWTLYWIAPSPVRLYVYKR